MDKQYAINLIRELFENPFSKEKFTFFIKNLLNHIEDAPFVYRGSFIPGIFQEDVKTIERIGKYQDINGKQLDILIVSFLRDETLERARSLQRNIVAWYLNGGRGGKMKDAALVAFISPKNQDWRFSFVKMEYKYDAEAKKIRESYTPAKRYSYLVGPHEASHTAQSMMVPVMLNDMIDPTHEEIEAIFKIEKVTKEFFEKYKELFFNLAEQFTNNKEFEQKVVKEHGVRVEDFVKKLMGQIVFLYFLQKKGWLGVKQGEKWGSGDKRFMHNLFHEQYRKYDNFYNDVLEHLFYDTLNRRDRGNSSVINDQSYSPYFNCRIPYLNGGLFTPVYDWDKSKISIENKYFHDIFDVFDTFNFTVFESDPIEKEVAVDPEMLGKVFENLLEVRDRKSKGAFYTPREIVHYMCQESLINYLISQSEYPEDRIRKLMKSKDQELARTEKDRDKFEQMNDLKEMAIKITELLRIVKVCDPAVGSGAFPMGLLKEISSIRYFLNKHFLKEKNKHNTLLTEYDIKKETLENCIYGVDIDPGAVEIARLRFWLALVVEHEIEEIEPLPNLDYKIMQGNSLIELLSPTLLTKTSDENRNKIIEQLSIAKNEYFNLSDSLSKSNKREEINLLTRSIVNYDKEVQRENIWQKIIDIRSQLNLFGKQKNEDQLTIGDMTDEQINKGLNELNKIENVSNTEHFEWHLSFNEVFEKGGFDIVIANPPYGANIDKLTEILANLYPNTTKSYKDIYKIFIELGISKLLNNEGVMSYIIPNTLLLQPRYKDARKFLLNYKILGIMNLGQEVFEQVIVPTCVIFVQNSACENNIVNYSDLSRRNVFLGNLQQFEFSSIDQNIYKSTNDNIFVENIRASKDDERYLTDILEFKDAGINYQRVNVGLKEKGKSDLSKRLLYEGNKLGLSDVEYWKGEDIHAYFIKDKTNRYVRVTTQRNLQNNERVILNKEYFNIAPKLIWRQTASCLIVALDERGIWFGRSIQAGMIKPELRSKYEYKYILAILNSSYLKFLYSQSVQEGGRVFPQVKLSKLKMLPIKNAPIENQFSFVRIVDNILNITKGENYSTDRTKQIEVRELKNMIDQLVYKLYDLTPEEIAIVEESVK